MLTDHGRHGLQPIAVGHLSDSGDLKKSVEKEIIDSYTGKLLNYPFLVQLFPDEWTGWNFTIGVTSSWVSTGQHSSTKKIDI